MLPSPFTATTAIQQPEPPPSAAIRERCAEMAAPAPTAAAARPAGRIGSLPMAAIVARVEDGAAWLDEARPGWADLVDLNILDLDDPRCCVLGQVFGGFFDAPTTLDDAADYGCLAYPQLRNGDSDPHHAERIRAELGMLTTAWRTLIRSRRRDEAQAL